MEGNMKRTNMKRFLLLFCMLACVFCMTACTDTISSDKAKTSAKDMQVSGYSQEIKQWANDLVLYLDAESDEQIKADGEAANTISAVNGKVYIINLAGIDEKTIEFYNSWIKTREDLGALRSIDSIDINVSDETGTLCTVAIEATYEERTCSFELTIDDDYNLSSGAINPTYTTGEKMTKAAMNTILGMGTVFVVLIFISFVISLLQYVNKIGSKPEPAKEEPKQQPAPVAEPAEEEPEDDLELVAVITAAIAASEGTSADGLVVRSIKKVGRQNNWK
jgi:sodium pump decarboxylase gamma subunit